ncbi:MAG TPA: VOC family protein [Deltaproteobacteria bacterium]|nr:VOC family protein [Deltaproteobacteria bacterium]
MIYLEDLLEAPNFTLETGRIAAGFRAAHELPPLYQLGVVVKDIESCAARLEARGLRPFFIAQGTAAAWAEREMTGKPTARLGMGFHHGVQIELIEPVDNAFFYTSSLDDQGRMSVHHIGFLVRDVDAWAHSFEQKGLPTWVRGTIRNLGLTIEFAYMDTVADAGIIIEFIGVKCLGIPMPVPPAVYHALGGIERLIGVRCLKL